MGRAVFESDDGFDSKSYGIAVNCREQGKRGTKPDRPWDEQAKERLK